ncbi:MAG: acylneuraminate cytidylyltransferase family protein [Candidatus Asgardarchaeia archaeon]
MIGNKKILCVITARAGSKGIHGKNYRELLGKPLFIWSVDAGLQSKYVDKVVVSSDCLQIKQIVEKYKTEKEEPRLLFILRPKKISGDLSKNEEALIHSMDYLREKSGEQFKIIVNLQPTSPCRFKRLLDKCLEKYSNGNYKSLFTAQKYTPFFWQKINNKWEYITGEDCCKRPMRQEIFEDEENSKFLMHDNGSIYVVDSKVLLKTGCRISDNHMVYETIGIQNLQIDKKYDFNLIESMAKAEGIKSLVDEDVNPFSPNVKENFIYNKDEYKNIGSEENPKLVPRLFDKSKKAKLGIDGHLVYR